MPEVGSSRKTTAGAPKKAMATLSLRRCPPDSSPARVPSLSSRPACAHAPNQARGPACAPHQASGRHPAGHSFSDCGHLQHPTATRMLQCSR
jgi:hypothetical protein